MIIVVVGLEGAEGVEKGESPGAQREGEEGNVASFQQRSRKDVDGGVILGAILCLQAWSLWQSDA